MFRFKHFIFHTQKKQAWTMSDWKGSNPKARDLNSDNKHQLSIMEVRLEV